MLQLEENGQVREEENLLSQQAEKNIAEQPRSTADKRKKQDHKLLVLTIAGFALVLAVTVFCLQVQIQDLNRQMSDLQSGLSSVRSEWSMAISSLRASIEQSLESQTSIVSEYHYDIISLQPVTKQARVKFTVTPKNCTADTTAVLSFTGADFEPITLEASKSVGGTFEGTVDLPLSREVRVQVAFLNGDERTNEALETIYGLDGYLLSVFSTFQGDMSRYAIGDLSSTLLINGSLVVEVQMNDSIGHRALANYPDSGMVRLIKNGKTYREYELGFYENEPKPDYENGNSTVTYSSISASVPMKERFDEGEWETIEIEITIVDRFSIRYQQIPYAYRSSGEESLNRSADTEITYPTK